MTGRPLGGPQATPSRRQDPLLGVERQRHTHVVTGGDTCARAMLRADGKHERASHRRDRGSVRIAVDVRVDRRSLASAESGNDLLRHLDAGSSLAREKDPGFEFHDVTGTIWATRMWLPNGSRRPKSTPYGCSVGSWVNSTPPLARNSS